ncbi:putative metal-binding protein [Methanomicrobium sp. W14]|uniref:DUF1847 domain-containing protein n=1 Tax=Methanomicrobium sp. W14 TaxID=2817839 RepID=UPI001AE120C6|nr:DUF1847 domain-containing protein [Methanomicrobium sp. W14]MBP2134091.1 putative metal-binding protein [Methanomicrobium sp. W14]
MEKFSPHCVKCNVLRCSTIEKKGRVPSSCPTVKYKDLIEETKEKYNLPENQAVIQGWQILMSRILDPEKPREKYSWTRVDEIIEYAKIRGMKKLGIATCYALLFESKLLSGILEENGFEVVSVCCLCGEICPQDVGLKGNIFCNPILQAEVLNREKTELNIMAGLCVGHDILFLRHCKGETTPLIVKDRALGHNPVAALYISQNNFYKDRFTGKSA